MIVVVGGGHSGGAFALALRRLGYAGELAVLGEEDVPPYERPALSKGFLTGKVAEPHTLAPPSVWAQSGALRLGAAVVAVLRDQKRVVCADGSFVPYSKLVLAMGAEARVLSSGSRREVLTLRDIQDARKLREAARSSRSALVVGGGVIGLEVAASLRTTSLDVTVVEAGTRLLGRNVPLDAADWIAALHCKRGVDIRLNTSVSQISGDVEPLQIWLDGGDMMTPDFVVVGIGVKPRTELAESANLHCDDGILVDETYASLSDPSVYAIGDVAARASARGFRREETWAHAQGSAERAARAILRLSPEPEKAPWFWTEHYDRVLQVAGAPDMADDVIARGERTRLYLRDGLIVGAACLDTPRDFAAARRLIAGRSRIDAMQASRVEVDLRKALAA